MARTEPDKPGLGNSGHTARGDAAVRSTGGIAAGLLAVALASASAGETERAAGVEFFERKIRPLLAEHCYQCHGDKKQESSLALNSAAGLRQGGDRGAAILEGDAEHSLLIRAVSYADDDLKMPPRGKLRDEQIADLTAWVKAGAVMPREENVALVIRPSNEFHLEERRGHWAYQPAKSVKVPEVRSAERAVRSAIDSFVVAKLAESGLSPSPEANRRTLVRRVTFDLTGLPPAPGEVADFLGDEAPDAFERLVDRLMAAPRYGERFGRHWLDVVRYSETLGFEFDYDLFNAWRYRDYVIRAFNQDLPYDQFVIEHLAGDLVPQPRWHPLDGTNESIVATGFWWMHEGKQTPVDIRQDQADRIDNQLDVLGKAFLGQTIACARCHDHKFDAISTRDYYALAGYLRSSRYQQAFLDQPEVFATTAAELQRRREVIGRENRDRIANGWLNQLKGVSGYLRAAVTAKEVAKDEAKVQAIASQDGLDVERLQKWVKAVADEAIGDADHPLRALSPLIKAEEAATAAGEGTILEAHIPLEERDRTLGVSPVARFDTVFAGWFVTGNAFGNRPSEVGHLVLGNEPQRPVARLTVGGADSGSLSLRLQGDLRSPSFTIDKKFVHVLVAGRGGKVNLVIDGYTLIMNPMYGKLTVAPASHRPMWRTMPVDRWIGQRAFLEAIDSTIPMHGLNPPPSAARVPETADGYIVIKEAVMSDDPQPPTVTSLVGQSVLARGGERDLASLTRAYEDEMVAAVKRWQRDEWISTRQREDDAGLINWLLENGLFDASERTGTATERDTLLEKQATEFREIEATIPKPNRTPAMADGTGEDEFVFLRGNWRTLGERAVRGGTGGIAVVQSERFGECGARSAEFGVAEGWWAKQTLWEWAAGVGGAVG